MRRLARHLAMAAIVLSCSGEPALATPPGTLFIYQDETGEELILPTPLPDREPVATLTPTHTAPVARLHSPATSRDDSLSRRMAPYLELVTRVAHEHGLEPTFVLAVIRAESNFDPLATSSVGAMGLMQIMPSTARTYGAHAPYNPEQNVRAGCALLADLSRRFEGDGALVLAAYSAGLAHVRRAGGVPDFSLPYLARVRRAHLQISQLLQP